jgi:hypothetical protein
MGLSYRFFQRCERRELTRKRHPLFGNFRKPTASCGDDVIVEIIMYRMHHFTLFTVAKQYVSTWPLFEHIGKIFAAHNRFSL